MAPIDDDGVDGRDQAPEAHAKKEAPTEGAKARGGEGWGGEGDDSDESNEGDGGEVEEL